MNNSEIFVFMDIGDTLFTNKVNPHTFISKTYGLDKEWVSTILMTRMDPWSKIEEIILGRVVDVLDYLENLKFSQEYESYLLPRAARFIKDLREAGIRYGFISNTNDLFLSAFKRIMGNLADAPIFASCEIGLKKPDPVLYEIAVRSIDVHPDNIVMIGDSISKDMSPAKLCGMKTIWTLSDCNGTLHQSGTSYQYDTIRNLRYETAKELGCSPDLCMCGINELRIEHVKKLFGIKC